MPIWKIVPVAASDDPRWLDHDRWAEVIVRASTAGMARLLAGRLEYDPERPPVGNENPSFQSGFEDRKLYAVQRCDRGDDGCATGTSGILKVARTGT